MTAFNQPPGPRAGAVKGKRNRQLLIYGGVGVALLVLLLMRSRNSQAADTATGPDASALVPVASPAADGLSGGSGVDNSSQLAGFESSLLDQLPQVVAGGVQAGLANGLAGAGAVPGGGASGVGDFASAAQVAASLITMGVGLGGQQTGGSTAAQTAGGGAGKKVAAPHPAASAPVVNTTTNSRAGQSYRVETRKVGGVPHTVHVYTNGHVIDMGRAK